MEASNIRNLLDTVHHEMDSMIHSDHVYKSLWSSVGGEPVLEKESVGQST